MEQRIPEEFKLYLDEGRVDVSPEPKDPFSRFVEDAQLAGAGWDHAAKFAAETSVIDARAEQFLKNRKAATGPEKEETIIPESHHLAKIDSSSRRKANYTFWLKSQLALGKSARELIQFAALHDSATANLLSEIAEELQAA